MWFVCRKRLLGYVSYVTRHLIECSKRKRILMKSTCTVVTFLLIAVMQPIGSYANAEEKQKSESSQGITVEDLGRGLKSAVNNVEKEIPKIGSAIGEAVRKVTGNSSKDKPADQSSKEKK